jgi:hypothetical protein
MLNNSSRIGSSSFTLDVFDQSPFIYIRRAFGQRGFR